MSKKGKAEGEEEKRIRELIKQLKDEDKWVRLKAARALGEMGEKAVAAVPALIEALKDEAEGVRWEAAETLGEIGEKAVPALIEALKEDEEEEVRMTAAWALGKMGEKAEQVVTALIEALKDEAEWVCSGATGALVRIGKKAPEKAVPALIEAMRDEEGEVRAWAASALAGIGEKAKELGAIAPLIEALKKEKEKEVRFNLAYSLAQLEGKEGEGIKELRRMKEKGELREWKIERFEELCRALDFQEKVAEATEEVASVKETTDSLRKKIEIQPESEVRKELLIIIKSQELMIINLQATVNQLRDGMSQLLKDFREEPRLTAKQLQAFRGEATHITVSQQEFEGEEGQKETKWEKWGGEIIAAIIGAVLGGAISVGITFLSFYLSGFFCT